MDANASSTFCIEEELAFHAELRRIWPEGQVPLRTVTNFAFVDQDYVPIVPTPTTKWSRTWLFGDFACLDLNCDDGQKTSLGYWEELDQKLPGKVSLESLDFRKPSWFRGGGELVLVGVGEKAVYVLQFPDESYDPYWRQSKFAPIHRFEPVKCASTNVKPEWVKGCIWRAISKVQEAARTREVEGGSIESSASQQASGTTLLSRILEERTTTGLAVPASFSPGGEEDAEGEPDPTEDKDNWKQWFRSSPGGCTPPLDPDAQFTSRGLDL